MPQASGEHQPDSVGTVSVCAERDRSVLRQTVGNRLCARRSTAQPFRNSSRSRKGAIKLERSRPELSDCEECVQLRVCVCVCVCE